MTDEIAKVAVVTGSARGIGRATAQRFLEDGWRVALLDIDGETLSHTETALGNSGEIMAVICDVAEPEQVQAAIDNVVERFGRIDALVNNAGTAVFKPLLDTKFEEWRRVLDVDLSGPFICSQACAPVMIKNGGGSIVNITSISGLRASTLRVAYGTSKAGLMHLTKQQAAELGEVGIRVNGVAPGVIDTDMTRTPMHDRLTEQIPLKEKGRPEDVAHTVLFLASDDARHITGEIIDVNGGLFMD